MRTTTTTVSGRRKRTTTARRAKVEIDDRRATILALGREAFATSTYDEVSIDELAKRARISKGLFYYYFPTKRDLYLAGLRETAEELIAKLRIADWPADLAPRARATFGVDAYLAHVERHGDAFVALMRGGIGSDPQVAEVIERVRAGILDELIRGAPIGPLLEARPVARVAIRAWIGMVEAASLEWLARRAMPREAVREILVDALFDLLGRVLG